MPDKVTHAIAQIRRWIREEGLRPGQSLPSARKLGRMLGLSHSSANRACLVLVAEGLITRRGYKLTLARIPQRTPSLLKPVWIISKIEPFTAKPEQVLREAGLPVKVQRLHGDAPNEEAVVLAQALREGCSAVLIIAGGWASVIDETVRSVTEVPVFVCVPTVGPGPSSAITTNIYKGVVTGLRYLLDHGHREIALVGDASYEGKNEPFCDWPEVLLQTYQQVCHELGLHASAQRFWKIDRLSPKPGPTALEQLRAHRAGAPEVTAVFGDDRGGLTAINAVAVPEELSALGFFNLPEGELSEPPLTTVGIARDLPASIAASEIARMLKEPVIGTPGPCRLEVEPYLFHRKSVRQIGPVVQHTGTSQGRTRSPTDTLSSWRQLYPSLAGNTTPQWRQLDLRPVVNRDMSQQNQWPAAGPLLYFESGMQWIHGVPFEVIARSKNEGRDVLVMPSQHAHTARGMPLRSTVTVAVRQRARALYFLHACTHARVEDFASYTVQYADGGSARLDLIAKGQSGEAEAAGVQPNIQDWFFGFAPPDHPHALHLLITHPGNPALYERYLYTLEWINPEPEREIAALTIASNPEARSTLVLFGVTLDCSMSRR